MIVFSHHWHTKHTCRDKTRSTHFCVEITPIHTRLSEDFSRGRLPRQNMPTTRLWVLKTTGWFSYTNSRTDISVSISDCESVGWSSTIIR